MDVDPVHYAKTLLRLTKNRPGNFSFPVPVKRLRGLCNHIIGEEQEADKLPPLTDAEQSVLSAIKADVAQGIQPTIRSVADRLDYKNHSAAQTTINRLIKLGYLKRDGSRKQIVVVSQRK